MWGNLGHFTKIGQTKPADSKPMVHVINQFSVAEECDIRNKFETDD